MELQSYWPSTNIKATWDLLTTEIECTSVCGHFPLDGGQQEAVNRYGEQTVLVNSSIGKLTLSMLFCKCTAYIFPLDGLLGVEVVLKNSVHTKSQKIYPEHISKYNNCETVTFNWV